MEEKMSWLEKLPDALMWGGIVSAASAAITTAMIDPELLCKYWYVFTGLVLAAGLAMVITVLRSDDEWWYMSP